MNHDFKKFGFCFSRGANDVKTNERLFFNSFLTVILTCLAVTGCSYGFRIEASGASSGDLSPDGKTSYKCGPEQKSASGCYNAWTKTIHNGKEGEWVAAYCRDQPNAYSNGSCTPGNAPHHPGLGA